MPNTILKHGPLAGHENQKSHPNAVTRRRFLKTSVLAAAAVGALDIRRSAYAAGSDQLKVGLIGCGWYGKIDLCRLIQVAPVEVVSLCDVDAHMLAGSRRARQPTPAIRKGPRTYADYREMLGAEEPRHRAHRHARPLARPAS